VSEALKLARVMTTEEQGAADATSPVETKGDQSDRLATLVRLVDMGPSQDQLERPDTPVRPVTKASTQIGAMVLAPSHNCLEVPVSEDDEEEMLDYEPSLVREDMGVNVIYLSSVDYSVVGDDDVSEMSFGLFDVVFQRPKDSENHLKSLYI
jgi:hypothetical protein